MDMLHDDPMLQGVRQMLGAFAKQMMRPVAIYDIFEGTGQIQRRIIARQLTGQNPT
jgi:alkylation response protein AidB-like acyl-CoA dehydrogenase